MAVEYRIVDNPRPDEFPDHICIETWEDGRVTSRSYAHRDIPVESRLNLSHPEAVDYREGSPTRGEVAAWAMPSPEVAAALGSDLDALETAASEAGLDISSHALLRDGLADGEPSKIEGRR